MKRTAQEAYEKHAKTFNKELQRLTEWTWTHSDGPATWGHVAEMAEMASKLKEATRFAYNEED